MNSDNSTTQPRKLIICRGLQGSGKSTFSEKWVAEAPTTRTRINRDTIRATFYNALWGPSVDEDGVTEIELAIARTIILEGKRDIIVDSTGFKDDNNFAYMRLAETWNYEIEVKDFKVDLDELIRRDAAREKSVGEAVIRSYHEKHVVDGEFPPLPSWFSHIIPMNS